jgi:PAS domain S-box-containing protein
MQNIAFSRGSIYGFTLLIEAIVMSIMYLLNQVIDVTEGAFVLFFSPVIITAWYGGLKAAILATTLTGLAITYFFLPPINSLVISGDDIIQATIFLIQSFIFITPIVILQNQLALKNQVKEVPNQRQHFEEVLQLIPIPILLIETETITVTFANKAADELAGGEFFKSSSIKHNCIFYHCIDVQGKPIPDEEKPDVRLARGENIEGLEMGWYTSKGIRHIILYTNNLPSIGNYPPTSILVFQDITKLQQTKAALWQSQSWLQTIVENTSAAVYVKDLDGRYLLFNKRCEDIYNIYRDKVLGKTDYDFLPNEIAELYRSNDQKVIESGKALQFEEFCIINSQPFTAISLKCPLHNAEGITYAICSISTEITDRKIMEESLIKQSEELAQLNRIKDDFLTTVSHELRTPLNAILGWSQVLRSGKLSDTIVAKALETIERNARSQKQLIEDILDVSQIITGKIHLQISLIDIVPIIETVINIYQPSIIAKQLQLNFNCNTVSGQILGDSDRLQQVIWNLLSNAIKFTPSGGSIEVSLKIEQTLTSPSSSLQFIVIEVTDTGIGIKPEFLPFVFDRFRQADSSTTRLYGGLGLGLAIVRHIVELHGGVISVHSEGEGKGATFTLKLPLVNNL